VAKLNDPKGWITQKLGDISQIYQPETIAASKFTQNGFPVYGANGIVGKYPFYNHEEWQTLVTCRGSTCGTVNRTHGRAWITGNAMVLNVDERKDIDKLFFYYLISNEDFSKTITGTGQPQIVRSPLREISIIYPENIDEQRTIAEALSDIDELIRTLKQEIEKKEILLRALSQRLIPWNFLTSLPTGWSLVTLGESGTITGAGVDKVFRDDEKEVTLINYMDVYRNDGLSKSLNYGNTSATAKQISNCSLRKADVLFTPTSETPEDIARSSVIIDDIPNAVYSYHLIRFRPSQAFDLNFLKHIFNIYDFRSQVRKSAEGSGTRYVITLPRFRNLVIPIPDLPTQSHIGSTLDETSSEIKKLKIELSKYEWLKQGMMNDLLTGKVRLI
jgi:type I restriction enzyme, S subunit